MKSVFFNNEVLGAEKEILNELEIPSLILMENAGGNSAKIITEYITSEKINKCVILSGKGNNAGDGFVVARHLIKLNIEILILSLYPKDELKGDALINYNVLSKLGSKKIKYGDIKSISDFKRFTESEKLNQSGTLFIDAVFGVGFRGELDIHIKDVFNYINLLKDKKIIALDTVSGLEHYDRKENLLNADMTIAMAQKKFNSLFNEGRETSGFVQTVEIGIPDSQFDKRNKRKIYQIEEKDCNGIIKKREINSHKYKNGKVFVLGGKKGFSGAVYLSSMAALKTGCGAVIAGIPESLNHILEIKTTEVITVPLPENNEGSLVQSGLEIINSKIEWSDVTLIGPGLGRDSDSMELIQNILSVNDRKFVIDADGLYMIKDTPGIFRNKKEKVILTPHYGEFSAISGYAIEEIKNNIYNIPYEFARENNVILVLKNSPTIITDGDYYFINSTGRENLATIGSGDVLSGIITALYSLSDNPLKSSYSGCYLHGKCGDYLYNKTGDSSTLSGDLLNLIPELKRELY